MFKIFREEPLITAGILFFVGLSLFVRLLLGFLFQNMIREADNMATTNNSLLKQCKLKFANCYQMNNGVANIPVFVDKFLNRLSLGPVSFETLYHLSGQSVLLSVICAGAGACKGIVDGKRMGDILPFYILSFLGLYLYFSVSTIVDVKNKRRILKVNLIDYLENHLSARIGVTEDDIEMLYGQEIGRMKEPVRLSAVRRGDLNGRRTVELMPINARAELQEEKKVFGPVEMPVKEEAPAASFGMLRQPAPESAWTDAFRISDEELADLIKEFC